MFLKFSPDLIKSEILGIKSSPSMYATFISTDCSFKIFSISIAIDLGFSPPALVTILIFFSLQEAAISLICFKKVPT